MIFENSSSKGIFRRNIRNSTKWSLKCSSRFLQAAALNFLGREGWGGGGEGANSKGVLI